MQILLCPRCKHELDNGDQGLTCSSCQDFFPKQDGIISLFNPEADPDSFASLEAKAHDDSAKISNEFMGSDLFHSENLHNLLCQQIAKHLSCDHKILELGSGGGRDIVTLAQLKYNHLSASDVSLHAITQAKLLAEQKGVSDCITFYQLDGSHLPFKDQEFDAIFMVAALHHFQLTIEALKGIKRCCKTGGYIMAFVEPNCLYYRCVRPMAKIVEKIFSPFRRYREITRSIAEEKASGFTIPMFYEFAKEAGLEVVSIQSHWVLTGFIYLIQQFCFRILGKSSASFLNPLAKATCFIDDRLTKNKTSWCWHYSVIYRVL